MKKRIVFTVTNDLSYDQRMQKICRSLCAAGYEVTLVGRERNQSIPLSQEPYKQVRLHCFFEKGKLFYAAYNLRLFFYLLFTPADVVGAIDLDTIMPCYLAGRLKGARLTYDAHEYFTEVPEVVRRPGIQRIWKWIEKTFVPRFDVCYTVSDGLAHLFYKQYGKRFEVIANFPVYKRDSTRQPDTAERNFILYQGALNEGRGLEHVLEAMKHLNITLKLAGEGDLSNVLRKQAAHPALQGKVEFLGFVKPAQLHQLTAQARIGLHVSENKGLSYYHSLSNKFLDYVHAGVPVLCTSFPEYEKINSRYEVALMIKNSTPEEIRTGLELLLNDLALYERLQKNCKVCARHLNWQEEEKKLLPLYEQLFR